MSSLPSMPSSPFEELRKAHEALYESEARLRALVTASSDAIYRMSADWLEMQQMTGVAEGRDFLATSEVPNRNWLAEYIHPEDRVRVWAEIQEAIRARKTFELEHRVRRSDGSLGWTHSRAVPLFDQEGETREWFGMASDITVSRQAAVALIQNEKLTAMGRLAASIAHEVNNPLESVMNLVYLARNSEDLETSREYLDVADRELRRAAAITSQTLRFYKQSTDPTEVASADLIGDVLAMHHGRIVNSRVRVETRLRAQRPIFCFDGEVRQVLNNLIGNAIDAMHPVGGRLLVRTRESPDWKTGRPGLVITVADTGHGMSAQTVEKASEAFYTTKGLGGTGLGLWVSKQILNRHHGCLRLRSSQAEVHRGTAVEVFLPHEAAVR